jgi:outer membrane protein OmpA-like peptidoglycan-associated protein
MKLIGAFFILLLSLTGYSQVKIKSIYFDFSQSVPTPYSQNQLQLFSQSYQDGKIELIKIYSFTDSVGSSKFNDSLAIKRLNYVKLGLKIPANSTIPMVAMAFERVYDAQSYLNWRRVDIYYTPKIQEETNVISNKVDTINQIQQNSDSINEIPKDNSILESLNNATPYILNVEFIEGTAKLEIKSIEEVKNLAKFMKENPASMIIIRGHVCCGKNMRISRKRARTVYIELAKNGIDKKRMKYQGLSNSEPLVFPERTDADRQRNRRVDVVFSKL